MDFKCDELILGKKDADSRALTDLQHLELSRNELQLLFDLGKEHLAGPGFLLIAEGEFDALAQQ